MHKRCFNVANLVVDFLLLLLIMADTIATDIALKTVESLGYSRNLPHDLRVVLLALGAIRPAGRT